jgi:hypothetical protein
MGTLYRVRPTTTNAPGVSLAMLASRREPAEACLTAPENVRLWRRFEWLSKIPPPHSREHPPDDRSDGRRTPQCELSRRA